jgi:dienelactone hydrolase
VVLLHGWNVFRGIHGSWTTPWLDMLARAGYCVLAIDQYGFGERFVSRDDAPGPPFLGGIKDLPEEVVCEARDHTVQQVKDARRCLDYLAGRDEVDANRVALMGQSLGAYNACLTAGLEDRLAAAVLIVLGCWPAGSTTDPVLQVGHTMNFAPRISCPVLMVSATDDVGATREEAQAVFAAFPTAKQIVWHESEHVILVEDQRPEINHWLEKTL